MRLPYLVKQILMKILYIRYKRDMKANKRFKFKKTQAKGLTKIIPTFILFYLLKIKNQI